MSLFGGGTDYPMWYREHGGAVIGMAIDKYCYLTVRHLPPFFDHRHRIVYSKVEQVQGIDEIQHPAVRGVLQELGVNVGLEIHHDGDLPARSGVGSSSSFTVGFLSAVMALQGRMATKYYLAKEATRIEQEVLHEDVGDQDQIWAAYGGFNRIDFHSDGEFSVMPLVTTSERRRDLLNHLLLFFSGQSRLASEVAREVIQNFGDKQTHLRDMQNMVDRAQQVLCTDADIREIGELLHESWLLKRALAPCVSTDTIDEIYAAARQAGALGGKLLGAGGGGFLLFFVEPHRREAVRQALQHLIEVTFDIDQEGSSIVLYRPNGFHCS